MARDVEWGNGVARVGTTDPGYLANLRLLSVRLDSLSAHRYRLPISPLKPIAMRTKMVQSDELPELSSIAQYVRPVIAPTFAFAFNIGCFIAIDINWFTLFNLTEHMVFAIKALPIAIGASICFEIALSFHRIERVGQGQAFSVLSMVRYLTRWCCGFFFGWAPWHDVKPNCASVWNCNTSRSADAS
jgi:hypothetical protein